MKLDLDKFGEIIDDFLTKNEVQMLITMPEGTQDAKVQDNRPAFGALRQNLAGFPPQAGGNISCVQVGHIPEIERKVS